MAEQACCICKELGKKMSLEHSIPQFLVGAKSPEKFKKLPMCQDCNNGLGLHVDGKFSRSMLVYFSLLDINDSDFLKMSSIFGQGYEELMSLLASGEYIEPLLSEKYNIYWQKKNSEQFAYLSGGHPIKSKNEESKLFVYINEGAFQSLDENSLECLIKEIRNEFKRFKSAEILICVNFGFSELGTKRTPSDAEIQTIKQKLEKDICPKYNVRFEWQFSKNELDIHTYLKENMHNGIKISLKISNDDYIKFLAKLFFGVMAAYGGNDFIQHTVGQELINMMTERSEVKFSQDNQDGFFNILKTKDELDNIFTADSKIIIGITDFLREGRVCGFLSISGNFMGFDICSKSDLSPATLKNLNLELERSGGIVLSYAKGDSAYKEEYFVDYFVTNALSKYKDIMPSNWLDQLSNEELNELRNAIWNQRS